MKKFVAGGAALLMSTTLAHAGGLDRSGQGIGAIFEDGNYAEFSFGYVMPSVTASSAPYAGEGSVAQPYSSIGFAMRTQVNDNVAFALIVDQPFGAAIEYPDIGGGAVPMASVETMSITALGQYQINERVSAHAGVRMLNGSGSIDLGAFANDYSSGSGVGYVVGGAYEIPDIALRVALTYSSAISLELDGITVPTTLTADFPQSVNLDFQTGIAADTLLFGSIRWADWSAVTVTDSGPAGELYAPESDSITYNIGVGRRFSDNFAGSVSLGYEKAQGGLASALAPTDGYFSIQVGGAYTMDNGVEISGGIRYINVGDATAPTGVFEDNSAIGVGVKVGMSF